MRRASGNRPRSKALAASFSRPSTLAARSGPTTLPTSFGRRSAPLVRGPEGSGRGAGGRRRPVLARSTAPLASWRTVSSSTQRSSSRGARGPWCGGLVPAERTSSARRREPRRASAPHCAGPGSPLSARPVAFGLGPPLRRAGGLAPLPRVGRPEARGGLFGRGERESEPAMGLIVPPCENDRGPPPERGSSSFEIRRRPTLPGGLPPSTIGAGGLNCRVRDGNGCDPAAMATEIVSQVGSAGAALDPSRTP